ncbi:MAG: PaaI family thioesterase [Clostridiales Family XIII bacterium]|jgi:acyl-CoA thioesterase|nr:PaaI family thioesterase [Clostridiales Family XIII bacterium]
MNYDIEKIRDVFKTDKFLTGAGIKIDEVREDYTLCTMKIDKKKHFNELGGVQGGAIATLGDAAAAVMSNKNKIMETGDTNVVSRTITITYLKPVKGNVLIGKARIISEGRKTCLCEVEITDDLGTKVAHFIQDGFRL